MEISPTPDNAHVVDASEQDFEAKVLERSRQVPVLVDFWAPWCGPCKTLGPTLEKLAGEMAGRFELVKVNVDENPMLAQVFRIQSIPAVMLFVNGDLRDQFMGAYPEPEIRRFLEHHVPAGGGAAPVEAREADSAEEGLQAVLAGDPERGRLILDKVLADDPRNPVALLGMGYLHVGQGDVEKAQEATGAINEAELEKLPERQKMERLLSGLKGQILLLEMAQESGGSDSELDRLLRQATEHALAGDFEAALEGYLALVRKDRTFREDIGRRAMLAVFGLLPPDSPLLQAYRTRLSNVIFS